MQSRKPQVVRVDGEDRAIARTAASARRPVQGIARYNQSGKRASSVAVGIVGINRACGEAMQGRKPRAIRIDGEHRAPARTAATNRRSIQGVARYSQAAVGTNSVAAACETMQVRKTSAIGVDGVHRAPG